MILGIDPGLENTGWAVINYELRITNYELKKTGIIKVTEGDRRLLDLYNELEKIIKKYRVTEVAYESLFFAKNAKSAMVVSEAVGVIKLAAMRCGLEVIGYTPLQVKMALTGYGRAEKEQVEAMVRSCLNLEEIITPSHAADAVAVALTHGFTMKI
jgi:crossover junction endodeoxyribonuclease RuvC